MSWVRPERQDTYVCPFVDRCNCQVKFRIYASDSIIKLESQGEHTAESHAQDKVQKFLTVPQSAAVERMVSTMPMLNATNVRRGLDLLDEPAAKISPSKQRLVQRAVAKARARTLQPFTQGEKLDGEEGSLNRLCEKIYLESLVEEHNSGGKHLELNQAVCVGFQFSDGVIFGNFSTPNLLLHATRSANAGWPMQMGFDATFGLSNKQFELMGITTNSIRRRANPICLTIVNKESAIGYEKMYDGMEGGVFQLVHKLRLCRPKKKCEVCDAVREQIEQEPMHDILTPPKPKKRNGKVDEEPFVFQLPLEKPMCDTTTKFSNFKVDRQEKASSIRQDYAMRCTSHWNCLAKEVAHQVFCQSEDVYNVLQASRLLPPLFEQGSGVHYSTRDRSVVDR